MLDLILAIMLTICGAWFIFSYGKDRSMGDFYAWNYKPSWKVAYACLDLILAGLNLAKFLGW